MLGSIFSGTASSIAFTDMLLCTGASLCMGIIIALVHMYRNIYSRGFVATLALLPAMVQAVIMLVNGNLGAGVAVMGAFSLVRFRSIPGGAREIASIFFAMAAGLAAGMGYLLYALLFTGIVGAAMLLLQKLGFGGGHGPQKRLKVTIPEDVDYTGLFDDLFETYTASATLEKAKTTNLGSLFELQYSIRLKDSAQEKVLLDAMRQRNGNLAVACCSLPDRNEEL